MKIFDVKMTILEEVEGAKKSGGTKPPKNFPPSVVFPRQKWERGKLVAL